jgi:predicted enzyme related to lactoylglutathione lyase
VPGIRWVQVAPKGSPTSLTLVTCFDSMPPGSLRGLVIRSDDIGADYKRLADSGVQFEGSPQQQPWATETVFSDPDGNSIVLQQA